jgi:peptidoglycan-N-acetylglucosamine deacetylase
MYYTVKIPWLIRKIWPSYVWGIDTKEKILYLTFDDGPHPEATPFVLQELKKYDAKATFFCIGKNVKQYPDLYQLILAQGHIVGNHTHHHLDGWKTKKDEYLKDVDEAAACINSHLFRPPYGKIKSSQAKQIMQHSAIIMWSVLSGDFDRSISKEQCAKNVLMNAKQGSIIVFHDSEKAFPLLEYALPKVLEYFSVNGYRFEGITNKQTVDL